MEVNLKENIIAYLKQAHPKAVSRDNVIQQAMTVWGYKRETCGRDLRELERNGIITKEGEMLKYRKGSQMALSPDLKKGPEKAKTDGRTKLRYNSKLTDLNEQLKALRRKIKPNWETYAILNELGRAISAKYAETKEAVLNKYINKF